MGGILEEHTVVAEPARADDIEEERLSRLAEAEASCGAEWLERFNPGGFGCHECLDRTWVISILFETTVVQNPACLRNPEWYTLAKQAAGLLHELYQRIGAEHLNNPGDNLGPR